MSGHERRPASADVRQRVSLWLATPQSRERFEVQSLSPADHDRWATRSRSGNQLDFEVSRALLAESPWLAGSVTSLSHSAGHAVVAAAPADSRIGVDLEFIAPRNAEALGQFAYSSAEAHAIRRLDEADRLRHFHLLWVFKEACIKALQLSLTEGLRGCVLRMNHGSWRAELPTDDDWELTIYAPRPDALLALVRVGSQGLDRTSPPAMYEWPPIVEVSWPLILRVDHQQG